FEECLLSILNLRPVSSACSRPEKAHSLYKWVTLPLAPHANYQERVQVLSLSARREASSSSPVSSCFFLRLIRASGSRLNKHISRVMFRQRRPKGRGILEIDSLALIPDTVEELKLTSHLYHETDSNLFVKNKIKCLREKKLMSRVKRCNLT
uniref:Uncharacterized protein n=1 Tax=Zosterops lateralis melanops TaxID=1220523 RepID=A0A8D2PFP5_ZOSLA